MILLVLLGLAAAVGLYELGKYKGSNTVLLAIQAEASKLENSLKAEENKLGLDVKALLAKLKL